MGTSRIPYRASLCGAYPNGIATGWSRGYTAGTVPTVQGGAMPRPRLRNKDLGELLAGYARARADLLPGDAGAATLAGLIATRLGVPMAMPTIRSYLNG